MPNPDRITNKMAYQLKITLRGIRPPIWRRLQVSGDATLHDLHRIIQRAMGWGGGHLHEFQVSGSCFGDPSEEIGSDVRNEKRITLKQLISAEKEKFSYMYDFGDSWDHQIVVEKILPFDKTTEYPVCLAGKRACPPEDCGGPWGYQELLDVLKDPSHPEYEEMRDWFDEDFDPESFSVDHVNVVIRPAPSRKSPTRK
ncbi:MAG: plasmid pRiA4b ORF-3 family protein [Thermodesulfobacteriota bacterium]